MDELDNLWRKFTLTRSEEEKFQLSTPDEERKPTLAAKFFTRRVINIEAVTRTFKPLWRSDRGFSARDLGENMVLFEFEDSADVERVLLHEPWSYDKSLVAFRKLEAEDEPESIVLDRATFWVQIHNLPVIALKKDIALALGKSMGTVVRTSEADEEFGGGRIMRVRVQVELSKPLCRGCKLVLANGGERWISFKYERLPNFCYWCGLLSHREKDCKFWLNNQETLSREDQGYGTWLRAELERSFRKMEIKVPGRSRPKKPPPESVDKQQKEAPPPPTEMVPPRDEDSGDMECEDISEFPKQGELFLASLHTTFEEHLRMIDLEIGFCPAHPVDPYAPVGPPKIQDHATIGLPQSSSNNESTRPIINKLEVYPLGDLTNMSPSPLPQRKNGTGTWKKKARAHGSNSDQPPLITLDKRSWDDENQAPNEDGGIYGASETSRRSDTWTMLKRLYRANPLPWCVIGNFNEIVKTEEMKGRRNQPERQMRAFREALDYCGLIDLRFSGSSFTWCNNRDPPHTTWVRLDRGVANIEWLTRFHTRSGGASKSLRIEINELLKKEEKMWRQRSRSTWLKEGDRNTKYFHGRASQRRRRNTIKRVRDSAGIWQENEDQVARVFLDYFRTLFTTSNPRNIEEAVESTPPIVTQSMNDSLSRDFTAAEAELAISQMAPSTAPGPDGMPPLFYKKFWHIVGPDILKAVLSCLNSDQLLKSINQTYITLIPKVKSPTRVTEFRPISLCNVLYKIISKVLVNRLKPILPHIISKTQSAFVPGCLITDNVLVAFETLHLMHSTKIGRGGAMALKLDMSKAYDRVEWGYLEKLMEKMGFYPRWISLTMMCISYVSYSILINGEPHGLIKPSRGLRQGDPLSPYLFLLCAEGLHHMIKLAEHQRILQGVSLCRYGPKITHLFFADDSLLFCRATPQDVEKIQDLLGAYERASGQQVNSDKTTIFFSKGTPQASQAAIQTSLQVPIIKQYEKYLGLPSLVGRNRSASFSQIKERVWTKLKGWKERLLSAAGKEVLIKAVAQAIPTYAMSCFKLPQSLCQELECMVRKFWWGNNSDSKKIHWVKWSSLCKSKSSGGLGFRELGKFNEALLGKQVWRLYQDQNSLRHRVYKAKFFPDCSILEASSRRRGSYAWQSLMKARASVIRGACWRVAPLRSSKVSELILPTTTRWNTTLIDRLFVPYDAEAIKSIPLSERGPPDKLIWPGSTNGNYTVKSGYRFLVEDELNNQPGSSNPTFGHSVWRELWATSVPKKIQHFLWRAVQEAIPTKRNLMRRNIIQDQICEMCKKGPEDVLHALWLCPKIRSVWNKEDWARRLRTLPLQNFSDLCAQVLSEGKSLQTEKFVNYLDEFIQSSSSPVPPQADRPIISWRAPSRCRYKFNYDGAVFRDRGEASLGVVAVEALACKRAVRFASEIGITEGEFEGDSITIMQALNNKDHSNATFGNIIADVEFLSSKMSQIHFHHVKRQGNSIAHALARYARHSAKLEVWMEAVPPTLEHLLSKDFTS
uniref:Reverse transcriptase domain-containing protein n=1 Tax=Fagus sylvatica TaxID=28930 RepID=A0A2N9IMR2_FAGSY